MKYIERVESTLKGGCGVQLGPKTVIVGPNGSGKSTIIQAIELATCGWVSDTEGRDRVKQPHSLARLFPQEGDKYTKCTTSTGEEFSWQIEGGAKAGTYKKPTHLTPLQVEWPFQHLQSVLGGDAASVQKWLEEQVFKGTSGEGVLAALPPAIRPTVDGLMKKTKKASFLGLAQEASSEARRLRAQATRSEKTINAMIEGVAPALTAKIRLQLEAVVAQESKGNYVTQPEYDYASQKIHALAEQVANFRNAIEKEPGSQLTGKVQSLTRIRSALTMIEQHFQDFGSPGDYCWVCGSDGGAEGHEEKLREAVESLSQAAAYADRCALAASRLETLEGDLSREAALFKEMEVREDSGSQARDALVQDRAAQKTWKNAEASRKEVAQLRARADLLTSASKSLSCVGKDMLTKAKTALEESVSSFLPEGDEFQIDLKNARVGLLRDGELHSALSGAEWSRVLMALACAVGSGSTLNVLVPGDRAWDCDTLGRMMTALANSESQIIVMSTVKPDPVEGWTLVDLTRI